jgi:hypothetical protein
MGVAVLLIGKSGNGKSASLRNFKSDIGLINVLEKPLPFKGHIPTIQTDDYEKVKNVIQKSTASSIVIDDAGFLIINMFMRNHSTMGIGNSIFAFYNKLADKYWDLIEFATKETDKNKIIYFIMHEETNEAGEVKPKTIGHLLNEKVCIEGQFSIVLRAIKTNNKYCFCTQSNGLDVAKSPMGMFEELEIDNDLKYVDKKIREYYNIENKENENKNEKGGNK